MNTSTPRSPIHKGIAPLVRQFCASEEAKPFKLRYGPTGDYQAVQRRTSGLDPLFDIQDVQNAKE